MVKNFFNRLIRGVVGVFRHKGVKTINKIIEECEVICNSNDTGFLKMAARELQHELQKAKTKGATVKSIMVSGNLDDFIELSRELRKRGFICEMCKETEYMSIDISEDKTLHRALDDPFMRARMRRRRMGFFDEPEEK